jgi:hypothetical protein
VQSNPLPSPYATSRVRPGLPARLSVMIISSDFERVRAVREAVREWPQPASVEWAAGPLHAVRRLREFEPSLIVVDAAAARTADIALAAAPASSIITFDDDAAIEPFAPTTTWPWLVLGSMLDRWAATRRPLAELELAS